MTSSELLRKRAERREFVVAFNPSEVDAIADCIEAAEAVVDPVMQPGVQTVLALDSALTALRNSLEKGTQ